MIAVALTLFLMSRSLYSSEIDCQKPFTETKRTNLKSVISNCPDVAQVINKYKKHKIGLVFAGEFYGKPESMFGHTMFLILDEDDLLNSDTISFLAKTSSSDGFLKKTYKGIFSKYKSTISTQPFYRINHIYGGIEFRDIEIFVLKEGYISLTDFLLLVLETEKLGDDYNFLNNNCSSFIKNVINESQQRQNSEKDYISYPRQTAEEISLNAVKIIKIDSPVRTMDDLNNKLSYESLKKIREFSEERKIPAENFNELEKKYIDSLYRFYSFRSYTMKDFKDKTDHLLNINSKHVLEEDFKPKLPHKKSSFNMSFLNVTPSERYLSLEAMPLYKRRNLPRNSDNSVMEILTTQLLVQEDKINLQKLTFFSREVIPDYSWPTHLLSNFISFNYWSPNPIGVDRFSRLQADYKLGITKRLNNYYIGLMSGPFISQSIVESISNIGANTRFHTGYREDGYDFRVDIEKTFGNAYDALNSRLRSEKCLNTICFNIDLENRKLPIKSFFMYSFGSTLLW